MLAEFQSDCDVASIDQFIDHFDHHSAFYRRNFFDVIQRLADREVAAVHSTAWNDGFSIATSYDMIRKVSGDPERFTNLYGYRVVPRTAMPLLYPSDMDGMDHADLRKALNPCFSPGRMAEYRQGVEDDIARLLEEARAKGSLDWVDDFAQPVTGRVTMRLLGLPEEEWSDYALPIHNIAFCIGSMESRLEAGVRFAALVKESVAKQASSPDAPGLIGHLARTEINGVPISVDDIERCVLNIIIGGLDTTQATFSCAAVYLARNPDRREELRKHPDRIRDATMEFLRVFASAPMTGRYNARDVEIDGHLFRQGEATLLFWPAGNFDPKFIERPMDMSFTRPSARNITFAAGPHSCLGQHLSRMELEAMVRALVHTDYALVEEGVVAAEDLSAVLAYVHVLSRLIG